MNRWLLVLVALCVCAPSAHGLFWPKLFNGGNAGVRVVGDTCSTTNQLCTPGVTDVGPGGFCYDPSPAIDTKRAEGDPFCCNKLPDGDVCSQQGDYNPALCCSGSCFIQEDGGDSCYCCDPARGDGCPVPGKQFNANTCYTPDPSIIIINPCCTRTGALSGDTLIVTRESGSKPVPLRDVKTGDHVPCLGALDTDTVRMTATTRWCVVFNLLMAAPTEAATYEMIVSKPGGGDVKINFICQQLLWTLPKGAASTEAKLQDPTSAAFVAAHPGDVHEGDKVLVKANPSDPASAFELGSIKRILRDEKAAARGVYKLAIDAPFMLAEGMVVPMFDAVRSHTNKKLGQDLSTMAAAHKLLAPLFTQHLQPVGTPAHKASWDGKPLWPRFEAFCGVTKDLVVAADTASLAAIHAWFKPLHEAYSKSAAAVRVADVDKFLAHDA